MLRRTCALLVGLFALGACDSTDPDGDSRLSILLTDQAGDVTQAVVTIESIELVGGPGGLLTLDGPEFPWTGDLTELENSFAALVEDAVVPMGTYAQLRVILSSEACIGVETEGGSDDDVYATPSAPEELCEGIPAGSLQMPSLTETGIKVVFQGAIDVAGDQKVLLLDFNVSESFGKLAGESEMWVMNPVIHGVDFGFTGSFSLTVLDPDDLLSSNSLVFEDFDATLDGDGMALASDGTATFLYVVPGTYTLDLTPPDGTTVTTDVLPLDVTIASGTESSETVTITDIQ